MRGPWDHLQSPCVNIFEMNCQTESCQGCPQDCETSSKVIDIEDLTKELNALRMRSKELEEKLSSLSGASNSIEAVSAPSRLRSTRWFNNKDNLPMSALYMDRYLNLGLTREELMSNKPIIGIANSGSDLAPCNRYHLELESRVRDGIRSAGAIPMSFPLHPIQESSRRPTATLDRNLSYLTLVELLYAYPFDGVVLMTGCDKTTPACLMAAATMNIPSLCLNVGPMLNGYMRSDLIGSGTVVWKARELHAAGEIDEEQLVDMVTRGTPSAGHCNTMGTASTMNALAEALGMALPGAAAIPAPYKERQQMAYKTGLQIVEMVNSDRKPSDIMTKEAFHNAIVVNTAIGGSTNAPIHLNAIAKHIGVPLNLDDWDNIGYHLPLLLNMQPAGEYLGEEYYRAGGLPAIISELLDAGAFPYPDALTVTGHTISHHAREVGKTWDRRVIFPFDKPMKTDAGFLHMKGNLFASAIMKSSVITPEFRQAFLSDESDLNAFECKAIVFDGPEDYNARLENPDTGVDSRTILVMRGTGPLGYPGAAEVVNMHPPGRLLKQGVQSLPCIGDGRQSGTSGSPSIRECLWKKSDIGLLMVVVNASPEAAAGGNLAILKDGTLSYLSDLC